MKKTAELRTEAINLRMSPSTKKLLRLLAEHEHRTLSNMLEVLILERASKAGVALEDETLPAASRLAKPHSL